MSGSAVMMRSGTLWSPCWSLYWKCCISDWQLVTVITDLWLLLSLLFSLCQWWEWWSCGERIIHVLVIRRWSSSNLCRGSDWATLLGVRVEWRASSRLTGESKKEGDKRRCTRIWTALRSASLSSSLCVGVHVTVFSLFCCFPVLHILCRRTETLPLLQLNPLPFIHSLILTSPIPKEVLFFKLNKPESTKSLKPGWLILNVRKETWNKERQTVIICRDNFVVALPLCTIGFKMCLNIRVSALIQGV